LLQIRIELQGNMRDSILHNTQAIVKNNIEYIFSHCYVSEIDCKKPEITTIQSGTEAQTFLIKTGKSSFILKISPLKKLDEIKYENEILKRLNEVSKNFITLKSNVFLLGNNVAVLYKYFNGKSLSKQSLTSDKIVQIAQMQAEMHKKLKDFHPNSKERKRFSIFDLTFIEIFQSDYSEEVKNLILEAENILREKLLPYNKHPLPESIIHEDLEMVNILEHKNGKLLFIDFGESHKAQIISDISTTLKEIIANPMGLRNELFNVYLKEYQKNNPILDQTQLDMIPWLVLRRTLFMFTYLLNKGSKLNSSENKNYSCNVDIEKKLLENLIQSNNFIFNLKDIS